MDTLTYRRARPSDTRPILALIQHYSAKGLMLPRSYSQVVERIRDFVVADPADPSSPGLAGVVGLHVVGEDLAEIRSLAVDEKRARQGIGRKLLEECLREAAQMGLPKVFALTYRTEFFERSGFQVVEKNVLPQKIWGDCVHCAKFSDCDEVAMVKNVQA